MENWQRNLWLLVAAQFTLRVAMTQVKPFLPLFLPELGVTAAPAIAFWAGALSSVNFLGQALFSPVWGNLADRYGRKSMVVRCTVAIGVFNLLMALAGNVYQLLALRFFMGAMAGYNAAAIALVATTTPDEHLGYGVGMIQTGQMAGTIFGPAIGGLLAEMWGYRGSFLLAGILSLGITPVLILGVHENFVPSQKQKESTSLTTALKVMFTSPLLLLLMLVIMVGQFGLQSTDSLIPLYVRELYRGERLNLVIAFVFAASAVANLFMAPILGRWGDTHGSGCILVGSLLGLGTATIFQAFVSGVTPLVFFRFLAGAFIGGVLPSVQAILGRMTPHDQRGSVFGLSASATAIGNFLGPMLGGILAANSGIPPVFLVTGSCLIVIGILCFYFVGQGKKEVIHEERARRIN